MKKPFIYSEGKLHLLSLKPGFYDKSHAVCFGLLKKTIRNKQALLLKVPQPVLPKVHEGNKLYRQRLRIEPL